MVALPASCLVFFLTLFVPGVEEPSSQALLTPLEGPSLENRVYQLEGLVKTCLANKDREELHRVLEEESDVAMEMIRRFAMAYMSACIERKKKLNCHECPELDGLLAASAYYSRKKPNPKLAEVTRVIEKLSLAQIYRWRELTARRDEAYTIHREGKTARALKILEEVLRELDAMGEFIVAVEIRVQKPSMEGILGKDDLALSHLEEARIQCHEIGDLYHEALCYEKIGAIMYKKYYSGTMEKILENFEKALSLQRRISCKIRAYQTMEGIAALLHHERRFKEAESALNTVIRHFMEVHNFPAAANAQYNLTQMLIKMEASFPILLDNSAQAMALAEKSGSDFQTAQCLLQHGRILCQMGDIQEGLVCLRQAQRLHRKVGNMSGICKVIPRLVENLLATGRFDEAKHMALNALNDEDPRMRNNTVLRIDLLKQLASMAQMEGDFPAANQRIKALIALGEEDSYPPFIVGIYSHAALHYLHGNRYDKALKYARKAQAIIERPELAPQDKAEALYALGSVYQGLERHQKALDCFQACIASTDIERCRPDHLTGLARTLEACGETAEAESRYLAALDEAHRQGLKHQEATIRSRIAIFYRKQGRITEAMNHLVKSQRLFEDALGFSGLLLTKLNQGHCLLLQGKADKAMRLFETLSGVAPVMPPYLRTLYFGLRGTALARKGACEEALESFQASMECHKELFLATDSLSELTQGTFSEGATRWIIPEALKCCEALYAKTGDSLYLRKAFEIDEQCKGRIFLHSMARGSLNLEGGLSPELKTGLEQCRVRLRFLNKQREAFFHQEIEVPEGILRNWEKEVAREEGLVEELLTQLRKEDPAYAHVKAPTSMGLDELQALLDETTAYLSFNWNGDAAVVLAVNQSACRIRVLENASVLEAQVSKLLRMMETQDPDAQAFFETARSLYTALLSPVESIFSDREALIVSPDGILNLLPLEVLLSADLPEGSDPAYGDLAYLVKTHSVAYVPSASSLAYLSKRCMGKKQDPAYSGMMKLLALGPCGGALEDKEKWLPNSEQELRAIADFFPEDQRTVLLGQEARLSKLINHSLDNYRIVHIASHAFADPNTPLLSGILLNPSDAEDEEYDHWRVFDIYTSSTRAELVVLSACNTSRGRLVPGEGVYGLVRAFLYAGADTVVATNWKVQDRFSAVFMQRFYSLMMEGVPRSRALQQAKQAAIHGDLSNRDMDSPDRKRDVDVIDVNSEKGDYAHPATWAPFILAGLSW